MTILISNVVKDIEQYAQENGCMPDEGHAGIQLSVYVASLCTGVKLEDAAVLCAYEEVLRNSYI